MNRMTFLVNIGKLLTFAEFHEIRLLCFTFYRSPVDQLREFEASRSQLKFGKHQQWLAMDFAIVDDLDFDGVIDKDEIRWNNDPRYTQLGEYWESLGGVWGGRWNNEGKTGFHDIYHFEV